MSKSKQMPLYDREKKLDDFTVTKQRMKSQIFQSYKSLINPFKIALSKGKSHRSISEDLRSMKIKHSKIKLRNTEDFEVVFRNKDF